MENRQAAVHILRCKNIAVSTDVLISLAPKPNMKNFGLSERGTQLFLPYNYTEQNYIEMDQKHFFSWVVRGMSLAVLD